MCLDHALGVVRVVDDDNVPLEHISLVDTYDPVLVPVRWSSCEPNSRGKMRWTWVRWPVEYHTNTTVPETQVSTQRRAQEPSVSNQTVLLFKKSKSASVKSQTAKS